MHNGGTKYTCGRKSLLCATNNMLYLENDTRQTHTVVSMKGEKKIYVRNLSNDNIVDELA